MQTQRIALDSLSQSHEGYLIPLNRPGTPALSIGDFLTIGRDSGCQLSVNDPFVSSRHARIERKNGTYVIRDTQSRNGTFLNGSKVSEATLTVNDRLRFGETIYVFSEAVAGQTALSSKNATWNEQLKRLPAFAATDFAVLITGPSGSGKEILARAIHQHSGRSRAPFVGINCSALSESLIESELFGHVRGSFTGATHDRKGAFESARGGTLFLDEIGDLPLALQPKLLRALENNEIRPVGSDRSIETDVRIVAATHKNLPAAVRSGRFREDLYYRLNVCHLRPPSLAERREDFDDLLYMFAKQFRVRFSFNAIQKLREHSWPGNVRELKNVIARASAYFPQQHIQPENLDAIMEPSLPPPEAHFIAAPDMNSAGAANDFGASAQGTHGSIIREIEREMIIRRLAVNRGNQRQTAKDLGMPKSTLHDRIKAYAINLDAVGKTEE